LPKDIIKQTRLSKGNIQNVTFRPYFFFQYEAFISRSILSLDSDILKTIKIVYPLLVFIQTMFLYRRH